MTNWLIILVFMFVMVTIVLALAIRTTLREQTAIIKDVQYGLYHVWAQAAPDSFIAFRKQKLDETPQNTEAPTENPSTRNET